MQQKITPRFPEPDEQNGFLSQHIACLQRTLKHRTGRDLMLPQKCSAALARAVFYAPFVVVSHDRSDDPIFTYGNRSALALWEMPWEEFTCLPSRKSTHDTQRSERARLLSEVRSKGFIDGYTGNRISRNGRRFVIENATVWDLIDETNHPCGQAAMFHHWRYLEP